MLFFSSALMRHQLTFTLLSGCMRHLTRAATWAEEEWGYIRNRGVEFRRQVLHDMRFILGHSIINLWLCLLYFLMSFIQICKQVNEATACARIDVCLC